MLTVPYVQPGICTKKSHAYVIFTPGCVLFVIPHHYAPIYSKPEVNHRTLRLCVILRHTRMGVNPVYPQGMTEPHMRMPAARQKIVKIPVTPFFSIGSAGVEPASLFLCSPHVARGRFQRPSAGKDSGSTPKRDAKKTNSLASAPCKKRPGITTESLVAISFLPV